MPIRERKKKEMVLDPLKNDPKTYFLMAHHYKKKYWAKFQYRSAFARTIGLQKWGGTGTKERAERAGFVRIEKNFFSQFIQ